MIWEAARATSAAPTFFERIVIDEEPFIDGGMGRNNPINQVLEEAELMFPDRNIACIVSLGTGQAETISIPKPDWLQRVIPLHVVNAMRKIATDCEESAEAAARRFEHTPGTYFRFNVDQGLQDVRLEQWDKLDEVRAHTGQYIRKMDVNPRLKAAVVCICGRQGVIPTAHISTKIPNLSFSSGILPVARKGGRVPIPTSRQPDPKRCPPPTTFFTGRQDILTRMREYFFNHLGKQHVFVLCGLGGSGKSQTAFKFVDECQVEAQDPRYVT